MARQAYPNFRRAQRQRGPYYRGPHILPGKRLGFTSVVALSSIAVFGAILFGDRVPHLLSSAVQAARNMGRERAPQPGDYFSGCEDARAAGVAPLYRGEPGYRPEMDGDSDGIACKPYRGR